MPNEWTFTAQSATWISEICAARPDLGFANATVEEPVKGKNTRHDLKIYDQAGHAVLCGEVKRPENPEGKDPMDDDLIWDAYKKATTSEIRYFFTWNINGAVLFDGHENKPLPERRLQPFAVLDPPIASSKALEGGARDAEIKKFLARLLERLRDVTHGGQSLQTLPLDELFLKRWEFALQQPVAKTNAALIENYGRAPFTANINAWMKQKQGMTLSDNLVYIHDNLQNAAKLSCYVLANRILFYKALNRNPAFKKLRPFEIPDSIQGANAFRALIADYWAHARRVTGDYETIFGANDFGDGLPFQSDDAVADWRALSQSTDKFDFTQLGFEVVGQIFERLLSPAERHKWGQHYTRSEVVDLINAFCIRHANATVFDPACGGGTFLVRAYARKKELAKRSENGALSHQQLLPQLIGNDLSAYPAHLTTINLATRDLIDKANYPFVVQRDFFDLEPGQLVFKLPLSGNPDMLDAQPIPPIDAVVGNPPYIRQEEITGKAALLKMAQAVAPDAEFSARSDLFCYFFPHALQFLKSDGWMGFLVSSSWLDTGYGFRLQKFLLDHFRVVALIESAVEPWFSGARVTTVAVILQRESDPNKRAGNTVRFAWANQPLAQLFGDADAREDRRQSWFESLRDQIEDAQWEETFEMPAPDGGAVRVGQSRFPGWRVRSIGQGDLERLGLASGLMGAEDEVGSAPVRAKNGEPALTGALPTEAAYLGSKWGLFLRAPDIFFGLLRAGAGRFAPLGALADIKRGITSGCDAFFFPRDVTEEALETMPADEMKLRYGLSRADTKRLRLIETGTGVRHVVEAKWLEPEVHSLMEIHAIGINPQKLRRQVLLVDKPKDQLKNTHVLKYIEWGESKDFDKGSTCAARALWYSLTNSRRGGFFMPMAQQYRHIVPINEKNLICNHNLFDAFPFEGVDSELMAAILNSTIVALSKHQFGRYAGREGNLKTEVVDTKMMLVPDPRGASEAAKARLIAAFEEMKTREVGHLVEVDGTGDEPSGELARLDRQALDDATLELLGLTDAAARLN